MTTDSTSLRILVVTDDVLRASMAGPAIRAWEMAAALAGVGHDVVLATTSPVCEAQPSGFRAEACGQVRFAELEAWSDVVVIQGWVLEHVPALRATAKVLVVDLYDPIFLEDLELFRAVPEPGRSDRLAATNRVFREQIARGDFFLCASDKQRDMWLGFLASVGRLNPANYGTDPTLRRLIDVVPFGLPAGPPEASGRPAIRGAVTGIDDGDEVILWGGGVYDWLDPLTAIRTVDRLRVGWPRIRLFFMGVRHPNPDAVESRALVAARRLAAELDLTGRHVFFNDGWVPYERRADFLLDADVGVSLHLDHVETAYSFRTRILDCIWAGLPTVATRGDTFADLIEGEGLGAVVEADDVEGVATAIEGLLADPAARERCRQQAAGLAPRFTWDRSLEPLVRFCAAPGPAPDRSVPENQAAPARSGPLRRAWRAARRLLS